MTYGIMGEPLTKKQKVDSSKVAQSYAFAYLYEDSEHPTAPSQIGHNHYTYDANGNPLTVTNDSTSETREMYWDEDNRLMVLSDNGKTSRYTYNAGGERIIKSHGTMEGVYINGAPQGITFHEHDDYTLYPASIISINKNRFTKHYFIGDKRIASKIGTGQFNNVYGINGNIITAGQRDYAARMQNIEAQREEYYKKLGTPPGIPTMKGNYADPENTGVGYNTIIGELGDHSVPKGWPQTPKFSEPGTPPGPPVQWNPPTNPEDVPAGYGYVANDTTREETFFYHSDHLGSTSYITDRDANITQFDAYLPYGELLVDEHSSSEDMPYKFNGKELDEETGLYYYGARYMDPKISMWLGVDPMREKYPNLCCFIFCKGNPIILIDPDGEDSYYTQDGTFIFKNSAKTNNIYIISKYKIIGRGRGQVFYKVWNRQRIDDKNVSLAPKTYSKIYSNILKRSGYDVSKLANREISVVKLDYNPKGDGPEYSLAGTYNHERSIPWSDAPIAETSRTKNKIQLTVYIHPEGDSERRGYLATESNVINVLGVHEFTGHGILKKGSSRHWEILRMQRAHPSWRTVTPTLKELYRYLETHNPGEYAKP